MLLDLSTKLIVSMATQSAWLLPLAAMAVSALGSAHCLTMCGAIVTSVAPNRNQWLRYQVGRLVAYLSLGAASGFLGNEILLAWGRALKATHIAAALLLILALWGIWLVKRVARKQSVTHLPAPFVVGAMSLLLPCAWLYTFVGISSLSGSPVRGALVLLGFWAGSLPALAVGPSLLRRMTSARPRSQVQKWLKTAAIACLWGLSIASVGLRLRPLILPAGAPAPTSQGTDSTQLQCH